MLMGNIQIHGQQHGFCVLVDGRAVNFLFPLAKCLVITGPCVKKDESPFSASGPWSLKR